MKQRKSCHTCKYMVKFPRCENSGFRTHGNELKDKPYCQYYKDKEGFHYDEK